MKKKRKNNMAVYKSILNLGLVIAFLGLQSCSLNEEVEIQPNIIFFFTDDQSYDSLKDYGNPDVKTPNLDKLASKGVLFNRHYNTTAICMASRANVITGQYEYKTGCNFSHGPLGTKQWSTSYPVLLKQAGYRTGFAGKFGFSIADTNMVAKKEGEVAKNEFDFWAGGPGQTSYKTIENKSIAHYADKYPHSTRAYGAATIDFINESVEMEKPFCMSLFFKAPHRPVEPDTMFNNIYKDIQFRKLENYGRKAGEHLAEQSKMGRQYPRFVQWGYDTDEGYQNALSKYHQLIYGVDYAIGMVLDEIERLGIDENTVIIFSSDNGYFNGSHGLGSKVLPYEEGARVPYIVVDPRIKDENQGKETNSITGNVDIAATILDLANVDIPSVYDGKSTVSILEDQEAQIRTSLPIIQVWGPIATHCLTVMDDRYKYIYWHYKDSTKMIRPTEELFDLVNDPYEMKNLASQEEHINQLIKMRSLYDKQLNHWEKEGVKYNDYEKYEKVFTRNLDYK